MSASKKPSDPRQRFADMGPGLANPLLAIVIVLCLGVACVQGMMLTVAGVTMAGVVSIVGTVLTALVALAALAGVSRAWEGLKTVSDAEAGTALHLQSTQHLADRVAADMEEIKTLVKAELARMDETIRKGDPLAVERLRERIVVLEDDVTRLDQIDARVADLAQGLAESATVTNDRFAKWNQAMKAFSDIVMPTREQEELMVRRAANQVEAIKQEAMRAAKRLNGHHIGAGEVELAVAADLDDNKDGFRSS